jgi:hypothetical protein
MQTWSVLLEGCFSACPYCSKRANFRRCRKIVCKRMFKNENFIHRGNRRSVMETTIGSETVRDAPRYGAYPHSCGALRTIPARLVLLRLRMR